MTVHSIAEARRKRDQRAIRIATGICRRERRIRDHEEALKALEQFYPIWPGEKV